MATVSLFEVVKYYPLCCVLTERLMRSNFLIFHRNRSTTEEQIRVLIN